MNSSRPQAAAGTLSRKPCTLRDLAAGVEDRDVEPDHHGLAAARAQVPAEPGLVVVRVDRAAEREHQARELVLHGADEPVDLRPPVGVGERVGIAAVGRPQRVDEPAAAPGSVSFQAAM